MARKKAVRKSPAKKTVRRPKELVVVKYQVGKSKKARDKRRVALHPGKRLSKNNKTYWETRRNRSDRNRKTRL